MKKILTVSQAAKIAKNLHKQKKKIVLAGGCFDILHIGHIRFLKKAKENGDILFLLLESDGNIKKYKGKLRPINPQKVRAEIISALSFVDAVVLLPDLLEDKDYDDVILQINPAIIATTYGDPKRSHKERQAKAVKGKIIDVTKNIADASTTRLAKLLSREL